MSEKHSIKRKFGSDWNGDERMNIVTEAIAKAKK